MNNLQTQFLREKSFEGYSDTAVLETMLSTAGVRGDIPSMINQMFAEFGTFKGVLEARPAQLMKIPGITPKAATLVSMVAPLARVWERCCMQNPQKILNAVEAQAYCKSLLMGERVEKFYVIALNAQCGIVGVRKISEGSLGEVTAYPRLVVETALNFNANSVIFCHNHPGGTCAPSSEDIASTLQLQRILQSMNIFVLDHIIVASSSTYSMAQHGDVDFRARRIA